MGDSLRRVEVVYARPERQWILELRVPAGTSAREVAVMAGESLQCPELDVRDCALGVHGEVVDDGRTLQDGDRLELYRPLRKDPRDARRDAVARGVTIGSIRESGRR